MKTSSRRTISLVLTFAMVCAMTVGIATSAFAATISINAPGDWATYFPGNSRTLNDGDVLNIGSGAGSPTAETVINIAANADVTINGNGSLISNLSIAESPGDSTSHTVTIKDLKLESTGYAVYTMYSGTLVLEGDNEFHAVGSSVMSNGHGLLGTGTMPAVRITSSTSGTLLIDAKLMGIFAGNTCNISGNAQVSTTGRAGVNVDKSLTIDSGASLTAIGTWDSIANNFLIPGIQNVNVTLDIINNGTLIATGGPGGPAVYTGANITMSVGAVTTLTNNWTDVEGREFIKASSVPTGYIWEVTGSADFYFGDTETSDPAAIGVPAATTGTIRLVLLAPPTITGPTAQTVTEGYTATSTGVFTVTGTDPVTVTKVSGDPAITWNPVTMKLDIAAGLAPGTYTVRLKASNGIDPDAYADFVLTVEAPPTNPIPPTITGPTAQTITEGYGATSTGVFTVTGTAPVVVTKVSGNPAITWNPVTMKLDIAPGLAPGTYTVKLKASNGVDPDAYATFTLTVVAPNEPPKPPALIPPSITGPKTLTIKKGYKKTSTGVYTVKGTKPVTVKKVSGNKAITWNDKTKKLDIAPGLAPGTYVVVLKASNGVDPDAYITFTLTVTAPKKKPSSPLSLPSTGDSALHVSWFMLGIVGVFGAGAFALIDKRRLAWLEIKN